jgi:hypothetical protein
MEYGWTYHAFDYNSQIHIKFDIFLKQANKLGS